MKKRALALILCLLSVFSASPALAQNIGLNVNVPTSAGQNVIYGQTTVGSTGSLLKLNVGGTGGDKVIVDTSGNLTTTGIVYANGGNSSQWNNGVQTLGTSGNTITLTSGGSVTAPYATNSGNADTVDGVHAASLFNNMGSNHSTYTDFNSPSDFGYRYIQGTTNGPGNPGAAQYYNLGIGLGNDYSYGQYAMQLAIPREQGATRYLNIRTREGGTWQAWTKAAAGYADNADTTDGQHLGTGNSPTFENVYVNDWFRNNAANEGLYNQAVGAHFYASAANIWNMGGGNAYPQLIFRDNHQSTIRGYVYADSSGFGLLHSGGGWAVRTDPGSNEIYIPGSLGVGTESPYGKVHISGGHLNLGGTSDPSNDQGNNWITWGYRADNNPYYAIRTNYKTYGSNTYSRLQVGWHTGVEIGAASSYGGTRFYNNSPFTGSQIMSIGDGDDNVRINNNLYVGSLGDWLTNRLGQDVRSGASPTFSNVYVNNGGVIRQGSYNNNGYFSMNNASTYWGIMGNYATNDWRIGYGSELNLTGWNIRWDASGNAWVNGALGVGGNVNTYRVNASANGAAYLCGGDDACLYDVNAANTVGIYGAQNSAVGTIRLGSSGATVSGDSYGTIQISGSGSNDGLFGYSPSGRAVVGSGGSKGVHGISASGIGVQGDSVEGWAGYFNGQVNVTQNLNVGGGINLSGGGNVVYGDNWLKTTHVEGSLGGANVPSGFYESDNPGDGPTSGWTHFLVTAHTGNSYQMVLAQPYWSDTLYVRRVDSGTKRSWRAVLDSGNYSGYAVAKGGDTLDNIYYFRSNKGNGSYLGNNNSYQLEAYSSDGGAAAMSFHRSGAYAVNFGLDPDNVLRIGGWSASANRWQLDMSGNETLAGRIQAPNGWMMGNGTWGGKLNFGDGNYVYLEEPTDDTLVIKASTMRLDAYTTEATQGIKIGDRGAKIKQIFYTGTTSGSNNGRTCINISGNTPPDLSRVIDIRGAIYAASNAVIPVHYFQNEWSWGLWYENGSGPTCGAGGPWLSIYPVLWGSYTALAGRTYNILLTYYE